MAILARVEAAALGGCKAIFHPTYEKASVTLPPVKNAQNDHASGGDAVANDVSVPPEPDDQLAPRRPANRPAALGKLPERQDARLDRLDRRDGGALALFD